MIDWLREVGPEALRRYISLCSRCIDLDEEEALSLARQAARYYSGDGDARESMRHLQELERRWYRSLDAGRPDYSLYDDPYIISDLWGCWVVYSRNYLRDICNPKRMGGKDIRQLIGKATVVVDLGCGAGYTTAVLRQMFPTVSLVVGTQIEGSVQYKVASALGRKCKFDVIPSTRELAGRADLVFASEYFEHFEAPVDHLYEVVESCSPRFMVIANAFNATALGHFNEYLIDSTLVPANKTGRIFNAALRRLGYRKVETKLWNNRPSVWKFYDTLPGLDLFRAAAG